MMGFPKPHGPNGEAGFSLVQVLVAVGVLGLTVSLFFQAKTQTQMARKSTTASRSVMDVNDAFSAELASVIRTLSAANPGCLNTATQLNARPLAKASGTSRLSYTQAVNASTLIAAGLPASEKSRLAESIQSSSLLAEAVKRCRRTVLPQSLTSQAQNDFYLCMSISQDTSAPPLSFLSAPYAFAEVGWKLINLQTGDPMSCTEFEQAGKAAGAQVFYSLYWAVPMGNHYDFKQYIHSFTIGK